MLVVCASEVLGEFILNSLTKLALPKVLGTQLGNAFVPNGSPPQNSEITIFRGEVLWVRRGCQA